MTKQEQVKEILEVIKHCGDYTNRDCAECDYRLYGECKNQKQCEAEALYNEGYRKVPFGATVLAPEERNDEIREMHEILEGRDELIAKVGILGRENYDLKAEIKHLNTIVERLDEFEKCRKCPAWSGTDCTRNPYTEGCLDDKVNLKNEIKRLEKENEQLKAKLEARLTCDFVKARQNYAVQDFADKLKEKLFSVFGKTICSDLDTEDITDIIDQLLKEYE